MTRPPQTWGKGSKAFTRYEEGRLIEEDEVVVDPDPHVFTGKDVVRADERPPKARRNRVKLPGPSKNESLITEKHAMTIMFGDWSHFETWEQRRMAQSTHEMRQKQAQRACIARGYHDWRGYECDDWKGRRVVRHVCIDCGQAD